MKRALASLASAALLLSLSTPALAARVSSASVDKRELKRVSLASYRNRQDLAYRRARYSTLVQRIVRSYSSPAHLAVTGAGAGYSFDGESVDAPTKRSLRQNTTLSDNCGVNPWERVVRCN